MKSSALGATRIAVSRLCFGTLTMGPLQARLEVNRGADLIRKAYDLGVNFFDTAELYGTYPYLRKGIGGLDRASLVMASRSYAYTRTGMHDSLMTALREIGTDYIDIFMLHEQESALTLKGHEDAIDYLVEAKDCGLIRAVGVSTHAVEIVEAATADPRLEVIHPIHNVSGIGIIDGNRETMGKAIREASARGKGIYSMKAAGGGLLVREFAQALGWVLENPSIHSIAIGMKTEDELRTNVAMFSGEQVSFEVMARLAGEKRLHIEEWCARCGKCINACGPRALTMGANGIEVNRGLCMLCGYCGAHCPEFAVRII